MLIMMQNPRRAPRLRLATDSSFVCDLSGPLRSSGHIMRAPPWSQYGTKPEPRRGVPVP
jgi:hypothetical protein